MWLQALPEADRKTSDDFFALLGGLTGTSDYRLTQADLARRVWAVLFSEVEAPFWARLDQLSPQLHRREGRYLEQVNDLAKERRAAIDALALRLSKEALEEISGLSSWQGLVDSASRCPCACASEQLGGSSTKDCTMPPKPLAPADSTTLRLANATDEFIGGILPDWLKRASPSQINRLRDRFKQYRKSQQDVRAATLDLIPLQTFVRTQFTALLAGKLPAGSNIEDLQWLEVRRGFGRLPGTQWPFYVPNIVREPGLLRLMQNFHPDDSVLQGSGLVATGSDQVLSGDPVALAAACRALDVGAQYQQQLDKVFNTATCAMLVADKQAGLKLAVEVAALKGEISAAEQIALEEVARGHHDSNQQGLRGFAGLLSILGCTASDALVIQLRGVDGEDHGLLLYLPSDPKHALQRFADWSALSTELLSQLRDPAGRQRISHMIALSERPAFLNTLAKRLGDQTPDLALEGVTPQDGIFVDLVNQQVQRIHEDARLLLVPTAEADRQARAQRLQTWEEVGLGLVNLAGLFIPGVGALLLGLLVVQTLSQVYEGSVDWLHGHQHEALEHMLGVAETVAVTAAIAGGVALVARGFVRSEFVQGLEPVTVGDGEMRLWSADLSQYRVRPDDSGLQADGLYGSGEQRWMRHDEHYYEVHRPTPDGPWRLRHPQREGAFGPVVEFNGERGWRLRLERPLEWDDSARMLERLWPQDPPIDAAQAARVMQVARIDQEELRGLLVANRPLPVNLRETLRRFDADARTQRFFVSLAGNGDVASDAQIQAWCLAQPGMAGLDADALREALLDQEVRLRKGLFDHLSNVVLPPDDALLNIMRRDFPGLPPAYAQTAVRDASQVQRQVAEREGRLPLALAKRARALLGLARLNRAIEGLYLANATSNDTGELVIALLRRMPGWPVAVNLELREGSESGRLLSILNPQGAEAERTVLALHQGRVRLYTSQGLQREEDVAEPAGFFEAISALLTDAQLERLPNPQATPADRLRAAATVALPVTDSGLHSLLGWQAQAPWFNPGRRLADGRVGYLLSGRGQGLPRSPAEVLRARVRALYPGFNDAEVTEYLQVLMQSPGSPMALLLQQERAYAALDSCLNQWQSAELATSRSRLRRQFGDNLRRAWRLEGESVDLREGAQASMRLDLSGFPARTLPAFPSDVQFRHVAELVMNELQIDTVPVEFLRAFPRLRRLTLTSNLLLSLPRGLAYLVDLEVLRLAHNRVRLTADSLTMLSRLPRLTQLDLSYNPLGFLQLRFNHLSHLRELRLRHCQLGIWPFGLELCGFLEYVDLRDNQVPALPDDIMMMPLSYRRAFQLERNPLPSEEVVRLYSVQDYQRLHSLAEAEQDLDEPQSSGSAVWISNVAAQDRAARQAQWDTLIAMPHSSSLFELLGQLRSTSDFASHHSYLAEQVWAVVAALEGDSQLREEIFAHMQDSQTCADGIAERFSAVQLQVRVAQANREGALHERAGRLIHLNRQLFRLERLDQFARADIAERVRSQRGVDEIEVLLYYRVELSAELDLPMQPLSMHYATAAAVSADQITAALGVVRAAETQEALAVSLSQRDFWQAYLRERHDTAFDAVSADYAAQGEALDQEREQLTSQVYTQRWQDLRDAREAALQALSLELTREVLEQEAARLSSTAPTRA
ncbi:NEL-type E3 ubiquitin ligase domain-containing protein [Pseudomonas shirazensis]|uniref:NEL-type E3 ubiquitin ligase domain-containing protein n=1 Tax=Pseudomonas shirazensis TaxID=2745494 RepID=UPI003CFF6B5F